MPSPIPHEPGDAELISQKLGEPDPPAPPHVKGTAQRQCGGTRTYLKMLPPKVRAAVCGDLLAGVPFSVMREEYGIDRSTYKRYRDLLRNYSDDLLTARTEGRRRQIERDIQWTLGVAKSGVELAQQAKEPVCDREGVPLRGEDGEILYREKPDTKAMSMFLGDAHAAIDRWGDLHELTGKGADRKNARRLQREELENRKQLQEAQQKGGFNSGAPLQVFVIPKLPGVEQYPAPKAQPPAEVVDVSSTERED